MPIISWILIAVASLAISYLLRPKIQTSPQAAAEPPGEAEIPTSDQGDEIPVFFGIVWSTDPHIVWWGDTAIITRSYQEPIQGGGGGGKK
jgi:hypothetical protein